MPGPRAATQPLRVEQGAYFALRRVAFFRRLDFFAAFFPFGLSPRPACIFFTRAAFCLGVAVSH